jgi:hypothetical protein
MTNTIMYHRDFHIGIKRSDELDSHLKWVLYKL